MMLTVQEVDAGYGETIVLHDVDLEVRAGEVVTVIGSNGAGKSTLLKTIVGLVQPARGSISFDGSRIDGRAVPEIVKLGIALVPEGRRVFAQLTVEENLRIGSFNRWNRQEIAARMEDVTESFPRLRELRRRVGGSLSGGEQQMLAIGRALMSAPRLLLLDEPSMGLAPILVEQIFERLALLRERGTTVLLVEQNASLALDLADRAYVLETGRIVAADRASELFGDPAVRKAYLGV